MKMNLNNYEHPADLKSKEILVAASAYTQMRTNNTTDRSPTVLTITSHKSSVNWDLCNEMDQRNICNSYSDHKTYDELHEKCSTPIDKELIGCERELSFIRAFNWLKLKIRVMREISCNEVQEIFRVPRSIAQKNSLSILTLSQLNSNNNLNGNDVKKKRYLIPEYEESASLASPVISFGESSCFENNIHNNILQHVKDSGIEESELNITESNVKICKLDHFKENNSSSLLEPKNSRKRPNDESVRKNFKHSGEMISSASVLSLIEDLRINNFVLGEVRIILRVLEQNETVQHYVKNESLISDAIDTIVQFLNQLITEDDMSSTLVYLQLCTRDIMATIKRIIENKSDKNSNDIVRQKQLMIILKFCNCRKICEETIDLLINFLTESLELINMNWESYENQPMMIYDIENCLICGMIEMAVIKYRDIVIPLRSMNDDDSHRYTSCIWRTLWKHNKQFKSPESHAKELEYQWIHKLQKLIVPEWSEKLWMSADHKAILSAIEILSTPPLCSI